MPTSTVSASPRSFGDFRKRVGTFGRYKNPMYLDAIHLPESALTEHYPFTVEAIAGLEDLKFETPVTFLVGENGCGKSSLIEAIACGMRCAAAGAADLTRDPMLAHARELAKAMRFARGKTTRTRLFFRAEDAIGFTHRISNEMAYLKALEDEYDKTLKGEGRQRAMGNARRERQELSRRYGDDPDARSHGEWFLNMLSERIHGEGLYILDEPETPLSPVHQLTLLSIILECVKTGGQFIIATHSPIVMACPQARIYSLDSVPIQPIAWEDVEHVAITRAFLADPEAYLRHL